jgi:hypothetical protein
MATSDLTDDPRRFPIGRLQLPTAPLTAAERATYIQQLAGQPAQFRAAAEQAGPERLEQPYRPGGWTGRQVIHHLADTHLNLYSRFRLALTEDNPTVRPFDEAGWAELPDVAATPIAISLSLLDSLHTRWASLLQHIADDQWQRTFYHPRYHTTLTLDQALVQYTWHGQHHLGHLQLLAA